MKIAVIGGDGIGVDVAAEGVKVLRAASEIHDLDVDIVEMDYGADRYLRDGTTMPEEQVEEFKKDYDAIYVGALGDPRVPDMKHARDILLGLRFKLDLFINLRPIRALDDSLVPLKSRSASDIDFIVFRENTEGLYVGMGGNFKKGTPDEVAVQEDVNTYKGVHRIITAAFEYAKQHKRTRVTMCDKSNALRYGHDLWLRVFEEVSEWYPDIEKQHLYVDALCMQLIKDPTQFEVIVTCNMFGDIITDLGAQLQGGMGMAGSGNIHPGKVSLFEPVHGSAPKYAGKDIANPIAAILTTAMMLEHLGQPDAAASIEQAVIRAIQNGKVTKDLGGTLGTKAVGDYICETLKG